MTLLHEPRSKLLSINEFLAHPDFQDYELVEGVLTEKKPMGALSSYIGGQILILLGMFVRRQKIGHVFDSDVVYRCFGDPRTGRKGDVSFIRKGRLPGDQIPEGAIDIPADLIVEVVSPSDLAYDVEAKSQLYLDNGFGELWVVFPNLRTIHVRRHGEPAVILGASDLLQGSGPLQGFSCQVNEIFPD